MTTKTINWGYEDSLSSRKSKITDIESLPKDIKQKLKLIEKAFR